MPRFAANLTMMYNEHAFLDRFAAAAHDGFDAVEYLFPYDHPAAEVKARLEENGLAQALFNAPPGDWAAGERGLAALPGREDEFRRGIDKALDYARVLGNRKLHVMAGIVASEDTRAQQRELYLKHLDYAAQAARGEGITILIEPINTRDMPGYLLNRQDDAHAICAEIGAANLQVQFDCYHCQIMEGDLAVKLKRDIARIGHIQVAGVPERHEPDSGEINYPWLFSLIDELGYTGWIGCEYWPRAKASDGLGWIRPYMKPR
ncbi:MULTISPECIES: 2-oxo-tetronate isomerase [Paraburkholderia]|uniref:Hydroxypyruvate isomerase n=1 Tax=Paraburkholderia tropica TaxID=92647 RepID=A0ABX5MV57_9BURK|nr:2-oxo-tetronate isomerase [Paraburkholderia tropica]MBB2983465.1 hydroxypyruvate isomerase [Paraburkholderia tropica]MBB3001089.1 hydroxypyruvate isomerase [Paraburkholderia tropica]MBB6320721.1 hydroxypyruvate isomerase [Paraburkholderia tropica]MDE1140830.1 hydroxypyruvate isomerase family protein [Paraburkholderia tropica]OBR48475.1 hydroxypyruvate isomerase [Paraburkholderia tropica]